MIEPQTIKIKDFKTIRSLKFDFSKPAGLHLIAGNNLANKRLGSNGAGKSSIFDALCWCLYGKTPDGKRGPDLVPWDDPEASPTVSVEIEKSHTITRTANPNSLTWNKNEVDQKVLDSRLGMNFDTFCHTVLLGQSMPLFFDLTPTAKMQLFHDVLGLERWEERSKKASKIAKDLKSEIDYMQGLLDGAATRKKDLRLDLKEAQELADEWNKKAHDNRVEVAKKLKEAQRVLRIHQRKQDDADLAYDGAMTEIKPLQQLLVEKQDYLTLAILDMKDKDNLEKGLKGRCPMCGGKLDATHMKEINRLLKRAREAEKQAKELEKAITTLKKSLEGFQEKANTARDELDFLIPQLAEAKADVRRYEKQMEELNEENPHNERVTSIRKKLKKLKEEIEDNEYNLRMTQRRQSRNEFWIKGFKDVELFLIEDVLQELELATNVMLEQLGLVGWTVKYSTETENKSGNVKRGLAVFIGSPANSQPVRWECWSGGEKQRLRVLGALALSEVLLSRAGLDPSIEILDEPSSHLSSEGVEDLVLFLANRARQLDRAIFFVDQTVRESSLFRTVTTVSRTSKYGSNLGSSQ